VIFRVLNRLIGRKDQSDIRDDAVNAYVDGNASNDELKIVEEMMRENPSLENDLSTQQALRSVLSRVGNVEAPRSFAITPEMVAAAEGSESGLRRFAELFAPQRKLALAPAIIAGIAALSVALLTIGDISGVVEQSEARRDEAFSTGAMAESSDGGASVGSTGNPGNPGAAGAPGEPGNPGLEVTVVVTEKGDTVITDTDSASSPAATSAPMTAAGGAAPEPVAADSAEAPVAEAGEAADDPESASSGYGTLSDAEPPSLAAEAPLAGTADESGATTEMAAQDDSAAGVEEEIALAKSSERSGSDSDDAGISGDGSAELSTENELAYSQSDAPQSSTTKDGISLPLWQLQVALAALALAAIGAWAGLRRARGE
jgi:hypothetical protein